MMKPILGAAVAVFAISFGFAAASPAQALTVKECSAKYKAAKDAGTLNGQKWNDFRKAECGAEAAAAPADATPASAAVPLNRCAGRPWPPLAAWCSRAPSCRNIRARNPDSNAVIRAASNIRPTRRMAAMAI